MDQQRVCQYGTSSSSISHAVAVDGSYAVVYYIWVGSKIEHYCLVDTEHQENQWAL